MEQMEILLNVPTVSKTTVSSTPKAVTDDDKSFADLYEQNIQESKSSNSETTQKSAAKKDESVDNSAKSETKVESKSEDEANTKVDSAEENVDQGMAAVNWLSVLNLAADSSNEESAENVSEAEIVVTVENTETQVAASEVDKQSKAELSMDSEGDAEVKVTAQTETVSFVDTSSEETVSEKENVQENVSMAAAPVSTQVSETNVEGFTEETNNNEVVVNTVQNEAVAQTANVAAKQTSETATVSTDFAAMMSDDIPQSNLQESVMTQIQSSLGKIVKTGNNEVRIQLEPEQLGVLNIRIIAGKDGTQVVFKADSHQSSQLIAAQTESLKTMLNEAGIKVDQILVNDFSFSQENYQDQQTFEQQNGKNNKFYKNLNGNTDQIETYDNGYELPQTIVGLNYLI